MNCETPRARRKIPACVVLLFVLSAFTIGNLLILTNRHATFAIILTESLQFMTLITASDMPSTSVPKSSSRSAFVVDMLSVGSQTRPDYQKAQKRTFASHPSVRNFFTVEEADDAEPNCATILTRDQATSISNFCRSKNWSKRQFLMKYLKSHFAPPDWLAKKPDPVGWICAQKRPLHGLTKAIRHYQKEGETSLPDYFIIMDDDTYFNMALFHDYMKDKDLGIPMAMAGCVIRYPISRINFTLPYGGFGTILNRESLRNLMIPISCHPPPPENEFVKSACRRLRQNQIGERRLFHDGMSIMDLIESYTNFQPFTAFTNWTTGYCFHSDMVLGFFLNFYNISAHVSDPFYRDVPHSRIEAYMGSEQYELRPKPRLTKQCRHKSVGSCPMDAHLCHQQTPESMTRLTAQWLALS